MQCNSAAVVSSALRVFVCQAGDVVSIAYFKGFTFSHGSSVAAVNAVTVALTVARLVVFWHL